MAFFQTILIVDDDEINNFISKRLLEKLNIAEDITVVINGAIGLSCLHDHCFKTNISPDLIFLDINMPVMDGFEFLRNFRLMNFTNKDKVIIAVLTTSSNPRDELEMESLGVKHYLKKPLTEQSILDFIKEIK